MLAGNKPNEWGRLEFEINKAPVSLQANSAKRTEFKNYIVSLVQNAKYLLSGDVKVFIEWYIHEQKRYETSSSADVDNIIKPLLDALTGPKGIMIDDSQVQTVSCNWIDSYSYDIERIVVNVEYSPDEFLPKEGLVFVKVQEHLYMPFSENIAKDSMISMLDIFEKMFSLRNELIEKSNDYYSANMVMSVQRVFHKGRLGGFSLKTREELLGE